MSLAHGDVTLAEAAIQSEVVTTVGVAKSHWLALLQSAACLLPFAITGALYESLRGVFRHIGAVHVADLAALEARLFSVATAQGPRPLSELIARQTSVGLDLWCGTTYALFLIESVAVTLYLLFRSRAKALELSLGFLLINLLGWLIWVCYPAAPPWYFDAYGGQSAPLDVVSSAAGLLRVDALLGMPLAQTFYAKSANVFGALPSLHVAYATFVACVVSPLGARLRVAAWGFALSMAFSAVYLRHHYILDVLAGILLALAVALGTRVVRRLAARRTTAVPLLRGSAGGRG